MRRLARPTFALGAILTLASCRESTPPTNTIVLYSSVDDYVLAEAVDTFERMTGLDVLVVGDTEATKTTGLVTRLLSERDDNTPGADVWWSSEPFGTVRLAGAGVLESYSSISADIAPLQGGWPSALRSEEDLWYGHALRARVIAYSTARATPRPVSLHDLTKPEWEGRVGIARPRFGTTRGHMASLVERWGADGFEAWLSALVANGARVYDSNSSVVRAIWMGEIDAGLTDTDDVLVGQNRGWAVAMRQPEGEGERLAVPCTVGLVVGGANPDGGRAFIDWVLGGGGERILHASESEFTPVNPAASDFEITGLRVVVPEGGPGHYERVARRMDEAMAICERVMTGG